MTAQRNEEEFSSTGTPPLDADTTVEWPPGAAERRSDRPVLLLVDNRPSDFTRYVLSRTDVSVVLLRFDNFADRMPNWPSWGQLPQWHRDATADVPSFDVRADRPLEREAARYLAWVTSLAAPPQFFCNPEEHVQDLGQRFAGLVGLPHLADQQVRWVRNKAEMKDKFTELGIASARYQRVATVGEIRQFAQAHGWPVVLKPVDSFATIDTHRLDSAHQLEQLAPSLPPRDWMVEEFVEGQEYQLCALVARGRVLDTYISINPSPLLETLDGAMNADVTVGPHCAEFTLRTHVRDLVQRLVDGMRLDHGYLHMEFFASADGTIRMGEIGARLAGCGIPNNHGLAFGFDILGATLDLYLQRVPELHYTNDRCVGDLLLPTQPGRVVNVTPLDDLLRLPGVISGQLEVTVGDIVTERRASNSRSGLVHVEGPSVDEVLERMRTVLDAFVLTVE
jgi:biotin carboxylase